MFIFNSTFNKSVIFVWLLQMHASGIDSPRMEQLHGFEDTPLISAENSQ